MITLSNRLDVTKGRPSGFDWLRIGLALSVVCWHSIQISYGGLHQETIFRSPLYRPMIAAILAMFFALSGFLVSGSLERCRTIISFAGLRVLRIFPALVVEVLVSAVFIGAFTTTLEPSSYFTDSLFFSYMLNMIGWVHVLLPGVFRDNPLQEIVNGQLWTVPFELRCYEALTLLTLVGFYRRKWLLLAALVGIEGYMLRKGGPCPTCLQDTLTGNVLVLSFLWGVALYRFRYALPWSLPAALISACVGWGGLAWGDRGDVVAALPLAYFTVYLGLCNPWRSRTLFSGDYSYGIFLYGFPIQQVVAWLGPRFHYWYLNLAISLPVIVGIGVFSWWIIEKPALRYRRQLLLAEDFVLSSSRSLFGRVQKRPARWVLSRFR